MDSRSSSPDVSDSDNDDTPDAAIGSPVYTILLHSTGSFRKRPNEQRVRSYAKVVGTYRDVYSANTALRIYASSKIHMRSYRLHDVKEHQWELHAELLQESSRRAGEARRTKTSDGRLMIMFCDRDHGVRTLSVERHAIVAYRDPQQPMICRAPMRGTPQAVPAIKAEPQPAGGEVARFHVLFKYRAAHWQDYGNYSTIGAYASLRQANKAAKEHFYKRFSTYTREWLGEVSDTTLWFTPPGEGIMTIRHSTANELRLSFIEKDGAYAAIAVQEQSGNE